MEATDGEWGISFPCPAVYIFFEKDLRPDFENPEADVSAIGES